MKEIAKVLYGSQNHGLSTIKSDKDYKVIMVPEFADLYSYHKVDKDDLPKEYNSEHYSVMSIMRFHELLMKGNPNCLEMLFSVEWDNRITDFQQYVGMARSLFKAGYLAVVWDSFYSALKGITLNGMERDGINNKSVSRAYYFYGMLAKLKDSNFKMNEKTWRGDTAYDKKAKNIRAGQFGSAGIQGVAESVYTAFNSDDTMKDAAALFCENNPEMVKSFEIVVKTLDKLVKRIVWNVAIEGV